MAKAKAPPPAKAPKKVSAPPPKAKSQTSPVLIIFLVFFILISLVLGVFLYLAQDKIETAKKEAEQAKANEKKASESESRERNYFGPKFRSWLDHTNMTAEDFSSLADFESKWADTPASDPRQDELHKWFMPLRDAIEGNPNARDPAARNGIIGPLNQASGKTATSLKGLVENLKQRADLAEKNYKVKEDELAKKVAEFEDYKKQHNAAVTKGEIEKVQRRSETDLKAKMDEHKKTVDDLHAKIKAVERELEVKLGDMRKATAAEIKKKDDEVKEALETIGKERQELKVKGQARNVINFDKPRGRVLRVDNSHETVYIDIGSDQRVTPQLTFSVYGRGPGGQAAAEPKATIEVISVVGKTVSLARVTRIAKPEFSRQGYDRETNAVIDHSSKDYWITDPKQFWNSRTPIVPGDLLYNPLWDPKEPVHVVIAGHIDLDGDGQDDIDHFRRLMTDLGVVVDGYLDPANEYQLKGKMDYQTEYVVVGGVPLLTAGPGAPDLDAQVQGIGGGSMGKAVAKLQKDAIQKGIMVVSLKNFLARMGHSQMRIPSPKAAPNGAAAPAAPAAGEGGEAKPAPKKEKEVEDK